MKRLQDETPASSENNEDKNGMSIDSPLCQAIDCGII